MYKARDSVNDTIVAVKKVNCVIIRTKLISDFPFMSMTLVNMSQVKSNIIFITLQCHYIIQ